MATNDVIYTQQKLLGEELDDNYKKFKRDGMVKKNSRYVTKRRQRLNKLWAKFLANHQTIMANPDFTAPYIRNSYYAAMKEIHNKFEQDLISLFPELVIGEHDDPNDDQNDDGEEDEQNDDDDTHFEDPLNNDDNEATNTEENQQQGNSNGRVEYGMSIKQMLQTFDINTVAVMEIIQRLEKMAEEDINESTFSRLLYNLQDHLKELAQNDKDIRVLGDKTSPAKRRFISEDAMQYLKQRAESAIETIEDTLLQIRRSQQEHGDNPATVMDVKLPRIVIPTFEGSYTDWQTFYDLYTRLIHNNKKLSDVMKMQYPMNNLKGEAARLIKHFTGKAENYPVAWELLKNKYQNKRVLVNEQISNLLNLPFFPEGTHKNLQELHDKLYNICYGLEGVLQKSEWGEAIILQHVLKRIDKDTFKEYEDNLEDPKAVQSLQDFLSFISKRVVHLEVLENNYKRKDKSKFTKNNNGNSGTQQSDQGFNNKELTCKICDQKHKVQECKNFIASSSEKRLEKVKSSKLCLNCLGKNHLSNKWKNKYKCQKCQKRHHTLLHNDNFISKKPEKTTNEEVNKVRTLDIAEQSSYVVNRPKEGVILTTILVQIMISGYTYVLRALLDQGSTTNIISEAAAKLLNLKRHKTYAEITGLGDAVEKTDQYGSMTLQSIHNETFTLSFSAFVLKNLAEMTPSIDITGQWDHLENLQLADPKYKIAKPIDMILGGGVYARILLPGVIKAGINDPIAQQTELGWIISGPTETQNTTHREITLVAHVDMDSAFNLEKFWELEEIQTRPNLTLEEIECETIFNRTHKRQENGRYMVNLPFKNDDLHLGRSRNIAIATMLQLERQFKRNPELKTKYVKCLQEYFDNDQIKQAEKSEVEMSYMDNGMRKYKTYYLPHHAVKKESDRKFRVVFDASRCTSTKVSLNQKLMIGPVIQDDLVTILTRWRIYQYVFTADIQKMYRQILMDPNHAEFQRMVWRQNENEEIKDYVLKTVTFGTASAPHTAIRVLKQLANDERERFPLGAEALESDFYVDDVMAGGHSVEELIVKAQ